jgi:hypothetical protein
VVKRTLFGAVTLSLLACIGISADGPTGGYDIVQFTVAPQEGPSMTVEEAGRLEFGGLGHPDPHDPLVCVDTATECGDAVSILAYEWLDGGLVPLWAPERVLFTLPEWNGERHAWVAPIPLGNLSCSLTRESRRPTVFVGECTGPDGERVEGELVMDR